MVHATTSGARSPWPLAVLLGLASLAISSTVLAQDLPSQRPLTSREGGGTKPNVVLTLDESGSMTYQYIPEGSFKVGGYTVVFPDTTGLVMHPDDPRIPGNNGAFSGIVPARTESSAAQTVFQKQMRSPDVNKQYYNPEVRYLPWMNVDGSRMANATVTAARMDPLNIKTTRTRDLTATTDSQAPDSTHSKNWCTAMNTNGSPSCGDDRNRSFNPGIYYRLNKTSGGAYRDPNNADNYTLYNINATSGTTYPWGKDNYPGRTDCPGTTCTRDQERQNFANWFVYHRSRLLAAQAGIPEAFQGFDDRLRVGWGDIKATGNTVDGVANTPVITQGVRDFTLSHKTALFNWIRSMDVAGGTPLRQALYGVGQYFSRTDNRGPWGDNPGSATSGAHKTCRRAYNVFVTDGYWNDTTPPVALPDNTIGNSDNTAGSPIPADGYQYVPVRPYRDDQYNQAGDRKGTLADVAMHFWKRDLHPDADNKISPTADDPAYWQHMVNFMVGFGVDGKLNPKTDLPLLTDGTKSWGDDRIDDLWHAAVNSRGEYFSAKNATDLAAAIKSSLNSAVERELKEAGVAAAATILEAGNRKYIPKYRTGVWSGDVETYSLDELGQAGAKLWSATEKMPAWDQRKIYAWDPGQSTPRGVTFTWANLSTASRTAAQATTSTLIDYFRGDTSNEGTEAGQYRARAAVLGDIINSTPVFAKDGIIEPYSKLPGTLGTSYVTFLDTKSKRDGVLYVGSNDGMLHGFVDSRGHKDRAGDDGKEIFAYIPRAVFPNLKTLSDKTYGTTDNYHKFFVDGPLVERDAFVVPPAGGAAEWRNYLVGSLGAGGRAVFALDVTDPTKLDQTAIRWEITSTAHPELGYITAPVEVGVLNDGSANGKWVAIFGNGYSESASSKAYLFVVSLQDGLVTKLEVTNAAGNGLGGVRIQRNSAGQIQSVYAGDRKGNLWKFAYSGTGTTFTVANGGRALFTAAADQPIVQPPIVLPHAQGNWIVFGTGQLLTDADANSTKLQTIYGFRELTATTSGTTYGPSNMLVRTVTVVPGTGGQTFFDINGANADWSTSTSKGWMIDMNIAGYNGLRLSYPPQSIADELAFFSLIAPAQNIAECDTGLGRGVNLIFPIETGKSAEQCILDTTGDNRITAADNCDVAGYATGADGIDAVLRSPVTTKVCSGGFCDETTTYSVQNTTGGRRIQWRKRVPDPAAASPARDRVWRRIINPPIR